ncbi:response regulator [Zooshikella marina]|uniref:hybrid sensor histidine kinase/response regulator n=1 Tax=Zooshikella ganghwensis TaxID=202772 RepID=UPI001BAFE77F|nr:hybrid sensor histidine kinase/response regulator [Zooshikella ganghwensis]MBU2705593.1 response regulator [Zooshikella ganghwensis]
MKQKKYFFIKHFLIIFIPISLFVLGVAYFFYQVQASQLYGHLKLSSQASVDAGRTTISKNFDVITSDLLFLANEQELKKSLDNTTTLSIENIKKQWTSFSAIKKNYDQIRWIDEAGLEQIRINYNNGKPYAVAKENLQSKISRDYFIKTQQLTKGEVYISRLDLNVEYGKIEEPRKPTIRIATPLITKEGKRRGAIVLNYASSDMLEQLRLANKNHLWLINKNGFWLLGPSAEDEWGFMLQKQELNMAHRYPEAWSYLSEKLNGTHETPEGFWTFNTIYPLHTVKISKSTLNQQLQPSALHLHKLKYAWHIVHFTPQNQYRPQLKAKSFQVGTTSCVLLAILFLGTWKLTHLQQKEANALTEATEALKLQRENEHIYAEKMAKQTEELQATKISAEQANQAKSIFLSTMSHEIRTPLNAIIGFTHLLEKQESLPNTAASMVQKIKSSGRVLLGIINDILDYSKIEANHLEIKNEPFQLNDVLDHLATIMSSQVNQKPVELIITPPPEGTNFLQGDSLRLEQILMNLTGNAIKYTEWGEIVVGVTSVNSDQNSHRIHLKFSIKDTGIGIPTHKQKNIFEPFTQVDTSSTRNFSGAGLGLTICRHLVELMGGQLHLRSTLGQGSEFFFTLPFDLSTPYENLTAKVANQYILVADDNSTTRDVLANIAKSLGWSIKSVNSGEKMIESINNTPEENYDILLVDWGMPNLNGLETIIKIKTLRPDWQTPVIIMLTEYEQAQFLKHPKHQLVNATLIKPITISSLYKAVMNVKNNDKITINQLNSHKLNRLADIHILVVDDSQFNREVAKDILITEGAIVEVAENGLHALKVLENNSKASAFDIILMDMQMPVMDGYEATRKIRTIPSFDQLPIVALSASTLKKQLNEAFKAGINAFVSKPIDVNELVNVILSLSTPKSFKKPSLSTDKTTEELDY